DLLRDLEFRSLIPRLPPADGNTAAPLPTPTLFPVEAGRAPPPRASGGGQLSRGLTPAVQAPVEIALLADADAASSLARAREAGRIAIFAAADSEREPRLRGLGLALEDACCYLPVGETLPAPIVELLGDP